MEFLSYSFLVFSLFNVVCTADRFFEFILTFRIYSSSDLSSLLVCNLLIEISFDFLTHNYCLYLSLSIFKGISQFRDDNFRSLFNIIRNLNLWLMIIYNQQ